MGILEHLSFRVVFYPARIAGYPVIIRPGSIIPASCYILEPVVAFGVLYPAVLVIFAEGILFVLRKSISRIIGLRAVHDMRLARKSVITNHILFLPGIIRLHAAGTSQDDILFRVIGLRVVYLSFLGVIKDEAVVLIMGNGIPGVAVSGFILPRLV